MKNKSSSIRSVWCLTSLVGVLCFTAAPDVQGIVPTIVVPNSAETMEGDGNNSWPFNRGGFGSQRYQQLYDASQFASLSSGGLITQIVFRPDTETGMAFMSTISNIQINLSTTTVADDALSSTYADNVGGDETVVFAGSLMLSSAFTGPTNGPKDFDIVITLTTPFFYDPGLGNLLLDVRNFSAEFTTSFDAVTPLGDGVSRVYNQDVNSGTGTPDSTGLVTGFVIVPEPYSAALLLAGSGMLLALGVGGRRRQRF